MALIIMIQINEVDMSLAGRVQTPPLISRVNRGVIGIAGNDGAALVDGVRVVVN